MSSGAHACVKLTAASITPTTVENPHSSPQTQTCIIWSVGVFLMCITLILFCRKILVFFFIIIVAVVGVDDDNDIGADCHYHPCSKCLEHSALHLYHHHNHHW